MTQIYYFTVLNGQNETEQDPVGLLGMEAFLCPHFLFEEIGFNLRDLPCVPKGRFKPLLIKEGRRCKDEGGAVKKQ